jgi:Ca2+-binding EF-hand superfamily protein
MAQSYADQSLLDQQAAVDRMAAEARRDLALAKKQDKVWDEAAAKQVNKIFDDYDKSDSGSITTKDFRDAIDDMMPWDDKLFPKVFEKMDSTGDGTLSKTELAAGLKMLEAAKIFDGMDTDNSGVLDRNQWTTVAMRCKFNAQDAENIFLEFDEDDNNVMDFDEFLVCMNDLQEVFTMNDIQARVDQTKSEIQQIEVTVSKLLSEIQGHSKKKDAAQKRKDAHNDKKEKAKAKVDAHLAFFGDKTALVSNHREKLDVMHMSVSELKEKFVTYKSDLHKAFENKQYAVCVDISGDLHDIKYELDEQSGAHALLLQAHADETSVLETKSVDHAQADVELRHLHDLLMEAEAHHDEIAACHSGALEELRDCEARYESLKERLKELEEQGARSGLRACMKKLDKQLALVATSNQKILDCCKRFNMYFKMKSFKEIGVIGMDLMKYQNKADRAEQERDRLILVVKDKKNEMDHIDRRNKAEEANRDKDAWT